MSRRQRQKSVGPATLNEIGEAGWLQWVGRLLSDYGGRVVLGFGDDAACLAIPSQPGRLILLTTDMLVEGTHFTWATATPATLGEKAVAVNVSDIAAMGGRPMSCVVAAGAPAAFPVGRLEALYRSLERACRRWGMDFVGGDTVRSERLILAPTVIGEFDGPPERLARRDRMRAGQHLYVTGTLGDSAAGLEILLAGRKAKGRGVAPPWRRWRRWLIDRHRRPQPRLAEGRLLAERLDDVAMIDLSDDLAKSVGLLAQASGVGATVELAHLPLSPALRAFCRATGRDPLAMAVGGGEDYEMLLATAADPGQIRRLLREAGLKTPVQMIGRAGGRGVRWLDRRGRAVKPQWGAFEHFASAQSQGE